MLGLQSRSRDTQVLSDMMDFARQARPPARRRRGPVVEAASGSQLRQAFSNSGQGEWDDKAPRVPADADQPNSLLNLLINDREREGGAATPRQKALTKRPRGLGRGLGRRHGIAPRSWRKFRPFFRRSSRAGQGPRARVCYGHVTCTAAHRGHAETARHARPRVLPVEGERAKSTA